MIRLGVVQFRPVYRDLEANTAYIVNSIATTDADVIVFPELATCGYFFVTKDEAGGVAEPIDGPHVSQIIHAAQTHNKVVVCGFAEREGNNLFNSALIAGPNIPTRVYRKTHLFYKESLCFDKGNTGFFVVRLPHLDCNLGVMI